MRRWTWVMVGASLGSGAHASAARAGDVVSQTTSEPYPGIEIVERVEENPNNRIYAAYVSLCTDQVHMTATAPATGFRTPGGWGSDAGVQLAINGDFFTSGPQVYGDAVGGGMPWPLSQTGKGQTDAWYYQNYGWIAFGDGWVEFNHTERTKTADADRFGVGLGWSPLEVTTDLPTGTQSLVSGFPELVIEGQQYTCASPTDGDCFPDRGDMRERHPRSAMGLTEDRRTLILVAVDGRDAPASVGMYGSELAALMADLGAWEAFNIDGGGSTGLWLAGDGYVNHPSDGTARAVANHWGVFAGDAGGQPQAAGSCFAPGGCFPTVLAGGQTEPFGDMPAGAYAHDEAAALLDAGWVGGCATEPQPMFCPHCDLTRGAAAKLALAGAGLEPTAPATATFDDVPTDHALFSTIETAVAAGLMTGCAPTSFCPGAPVLRGELAGIIHRAAGWDPPTGDGTGYDDVPDVLDSYPDVQSLVEHCADEPCGTGMYCPNTEAERGEAAIMFARAFGLVPTGVCGPEGGSDTGSTAGDGGGDEGPNTSAGDDAAATGGDTSMGGSGSGVGADGGDGDDGGCGCHAAGPSRRRGVAWSLLTVFGVLVVRRRPRGAARAFAGAQPPAP